MKRILAYTAYAIGLALVAVQMLYKEEMMKFSIKTQISMQKVDLKPLAFIFSYPVIAFGTGFYILYILVVSHDKIRAVFDMIFLMLGIGLMSLLKLMVHEERPFTHIDGPEAFDCECDYGNPSGHSFFAVASAFLIYDKFFKRNTELFL